MVPDGTAGDTIAFGPPDRFTEGPPLDSRLEQLMESGNRAFSENGSVDAEAAWRAALTDAERLGPDAPHLFPPLDRLDHLYQTQGRPAEAEPLLRRALA